MESVTQTILNLASQLGAQIVGAFWHFGIDPVSAVAVFCICYLIYWAVA